MYVTHAQIINKVLSEERYRADKSRLKRAAKLLSNAKTAAMYALRHSQRHATAKQTGVDLLQDQSKEETEKRIPEWLQELLAALEVGASGDELGNEIVPSIWTAFSSLEET